MSVHVARWPMVVLLIGFVAGLAMAETKPPPGPLTFNIQSGGDREDPGGGTKHHQFIYSVEEWAAVTKPLSTPATDAAQERENVAQALLLFDLLLRRKTVDAKQEVDEPSWQGNKDFDLGQMNCVNVTHNTTMVLRQFHGEGLLLFHQPGSYGGEHRDGRAKLKGWFKDKGHFAAYIIETGKPPRPPYTTYMLDRWHYKLGYGITLLQRHDLWDKELEPDGSPPNREVMIKGRFRLPRPAKAND